MSIFQNPYMQQMGILPMQQEQKPLQGIFSPQGLTTLGAALLAGSGQGQGDAAVIGNAILGTKSYIDQYNDKLNEGALRNATYNLNLANSAADYDIKQKQLAADADYRGKQLGMEERKLGILEQQQAAKDALNSQINSIIMGGSQMPQPMPYEDNQAQMTMMPQQAMAPQQPMGILPDASRADTMMKLGAISKNPSLVSYGKSLIDQQQNSPEFVANKKEAEKFGNLRGEDKAAFEGLATKMPELLKTVGELRDLADKATFSLVGRGVDFVAKQGFGATTGGAEARQKYINKVNNQILPLLRDTFGSQFTATEGESLKATLGDPSMTPVEKQAVLDAFVEQKIKDVQVGARRFGYQVPDYNMQQSYPVTKTINWSDL